MLIKKNTGNFCYKPRFTMFKSLIIASLALSTSHLKAETDSDTHSEFHYQHHKHHAHKKHRSGIAFEDVSHLLDFERVDDLLTVPIADRIGGVAWLDYDNDDDLDLFIANAPGGNNALFRNDKGKFVDVAVDAGITGDKSGFTGALAGDINNDGWLDLVITTFAKGEYVHYSDKGVFSAKNLVLIPNRKDARHVLAMGIGDLNRDGGLDLVLGNHSGLPTFMAKGEFDRNRILYNENGRFNQENVLDTPGIPGETLSVLLSDFNQKKHYPKMNISSDVDTNLEEINLIREKRLPSKALRHCMSNSYAFGGNNASLILSSEWAN